jgi:hypothetical protein
MIDEEVLIKQDYQYKNKNEGQPVSRNTTKSTHAN